MSLFRLGCNATRLQQNDRTLKVERDGIRVEGAATPASPPQNNGEQKTKTEDAFEPLFEYFPAETISLFLAAVSLLNSIDKAPDAASLSYRFGLLAFFAVLTPLMVLLVAYATYHERQRMGLIPSDQQFVIPWFDLFASAVAFVPWAMAVPGLFPKGLITDGTWTTEVLQLFAAFFAYAVSWFLSQLRRIVGTQNPQGNAS